MATGLPVVATSVDGVHEVLCSGPQDPAGTVVPTDRHDVLVRELHRRLDDPSMLDRESVAGPLRAKARFAPESVACLLDAAYREAIHQHRLEHR
jgi:glycosyltransferase involved in cell wall biosynthesis